MRFGLSALAVTFGLAVSACDGQVVVDATTGAGGGGGAGGGNGGNGGSTGASPTGPATGTATSAGGTTGSGTNGVCDSYCATINKLGCGEPGSDCVGNCVERFASAGNCADELTLVLQCLTNNSSSCSVPSACIGASNAFESCVAPGNCGDETCGVGSDGSCTCKSVCDGKDLVVDCNSGFCACFVDGQPVGKCNNSGFDCGLFESCCGTFF